VVRELSPRLPADAQVSVDVGSVTYWYARHLRLPPGVPAHLSSTLASMGSALPYGVAARLAHPDRPLVALAGDGAMQMNGIAELITVSRLWPQWKDPRFVVCVLSNGDLAEVTWEQRETEGDPRYPDTQDLPAFPYAAYAELLGLTGIRVDDPAAIGEAWDRALAADRPVVLEAVVDRDVPLLPPFPAGRSKLDMMRTGLEQEGDAGRHARDLLDAQAAQEDARAGEDSERPLVMRAGLRLSEAERLQRLKPPTDRVRAMLDTDAGTRSMISSRSPTRSCLGSGSTSRRSTPHRSSGPRRRPPTRI
jgi:pyruvate dehydrogenase (quinone)